MGYNKFITKGGAVILDLSNITVTAEKLGQGSTAVDKTGALITGVMEGPKSALIDVEALPTENIDPTMVYRTTEIFSEPTILYAYMPDEGFPVMTLGQLFVIAMVGDPEGKLVENYYEVDELPAEMEVTDFDDDTETTFVHIYILKSTGVGYISFYGGGSLLTGPLGDLFFGDPALDKGYIDGPNSITEAGCYTVRGANYSVYHYWAYNENKWVELVDTIEAPELPTENIDLGVCYVLVAADGKKQYFVYNNSEWVEYSSGGGEDFINYISGIDAETFEIPKDVENIAAYACYGRKYKAVVIPNAVKTIGENAFLNCSELTDVYFTGSEDEWNAITVNAGNDVLANATKTYNYEKNS